MKSERVLTAILTVAILGAVVIWSAMRANNLSTPKKSQPDEVIWALIRSCREGDVDGYIGCFGSSLRERLEKLMKEQGDEKFRTYLKQLIAPVKGIAIFEPKRDAEGNWRVVAEFVFVDRTERQVFIVREVGNEWKIVGVESSRPVPVLVPYGTPVKGL